MSGWLPHADLHNGLKATLKVESEPGRGAKFVAELPIERTEKSSDPPTQTILLVDDDALDAKRVRLALEGYVLRWVRNLEEAAEELQKTRFGLVLLDLSLPDGHGLALTNHLGHLKPDKRQ